MVGSVSQWVGMFFSGLDLSFSVGICFSTGGICFLVGGIGFSVGGICVSVGVLCFQLVEFVFLWVGFVLSGWNLLVIEQKLCKIFSPMNTFGSDY